MSRMAQCILPCAVPDEVIPTQGEGSTGATRGDDGVGREASRTGSSRERQKCTGCDSR